MALIASSALESIHTRAIILISILLRGLLSSLGNLALRILKSAPPYKIACLTSDVQTPHLNIRNIANSILIAITETDPESATIRPASVSKNVEPHELSIFLHHY